MQLPYIVNKVLNEYLTLFHHHFPNTMEGFYLHGSLALDAYVDNASDIDYIMITNRPLSEKDEAALSNIHSTITEKYEKPELDGVYIQWNDLGKLDQNKNDKYLYFNSGKLLHGAYFNFNPITWWLIKNKGINISGKDIKACAINIQQEELTAYVLDNMNTYWASLIQRAEDSLDEMVKLPTEKIDFQIEWTVLGILRQYYTLNEHDIISKLAAGEYGLRHLPAEWHPIIEEAINIRKSGVKIGFRSEKERIEQTISFAKYLMKNCNSLVEK
ncbi:DUF4111 domain-containing protein [Gracilibacillus oryzae]|uniref:DUF4111 domain-containing protein n=1 Tax=Gracilibacillus oryzae TaxID=1672701 RepID=A0A7C8GTE5_9BACI|nr:aminoglycoside adenylyltransferase domain-containing protein [Gracilibacillus oryzae]KAB8135766.1 DUF4111 domain-containing protein [Gracilibacillus oryzae]